MRAGRRIALGLSALVIVVGAAGVVASGVWKAPEAAELPIVEDTAAPAASVEAPPKFKSDEERAQWTQRVLDEALDAEPRDDTWAGPMEKTFQAAGGTPEIASIEAKCGKTMCRLRIAFANGPDRKALERLFMQPEFGAGGYHTLDAADPSRIRVYVSREGAALQDNPHFLDALAAR